MKIYQLKCYVTIILHYSERCIMYIHTNITYLLIISLMATKIYIYLTNYLHVANCNHIKNFIILLNLN